MTGAGAAPALPGSVTCEPAVGAEGSATPGAVRGVAASGAIG
jgi:hypothetical protein